MHRALIETARPRQWLKNLLVVGAPGAAGVLGDLDRVALVTVAVAAFSLGASGTYFWNDVFDVDADRRHPSKSRRPIAAGRLGVAPACAIGSILMMSSLALMAATGQWSAVGWLAGYLVLSLTYSIVWKHVAVVDIVAVASGFVIRGLAGAAVVDVAASRWFVLVTTFGALFVVAAKRFAEARDLGSHGPAVRAALADYGDGVLRLIVGASCGAALVAYGLWAFETGEVASTTVPYAEISIVPMVIALFRYAVVVERGAGAVPEDVFLRDRVLQVAGALWAIVVTLAVYA